MLEGQEDIEIEDISDEEIERLSLEKRHNEMMSLFKKLLIATEKDNTLDSKFIKELEIILNKINDKEPGIKPAIL